MKQRFGQAIHNSHPIILPPICLTCAKLPLQLFGDIAATARTRSVVARNCIILVRLFEVPRSLPPQFSGVFAVFGYGGGAVRSANFGNAKDGFPALETGLAFGSWVAKTGGREGALCPAIVDAGKVPVYFVRGGVAVELVADIDEVLDRGYVDIVDGRKVEYDGFEGGFVSINWCGLAAAWAWVIPRTILLN